ncbi:DNA-binding MarR family transcriptional regulator [Sphingobium sp. B11D3B]|uniref:MarR family winged helix-turn-helix transcriptional regulator n=1 Tax=Sphingobium sp. B11D3B TaxID=2940575 RepID=UPI002227EE64|nr:MarR family transcriptional regulator [Sphingobium sp. B11D3B]MCW2389655.1 DNA-binding MarR family transcriptional regulator [Sphingobium sp. B11D3B]
MMAILEQQWSTAGAWNIPYLVLLVAKLVDRITAHHVKQMASLSLAEWRAMAQIVELQPCNATQIAQRSLVDPAEVSRALRSLEKRGFVQRYRNPKNLKSRVVMLTAEGERVRSAIRGERDEFYEQWMENLSSADLTTMDAGLRSIAKKIVAIAPHVVEG